MQRVRTAWWIALFLLWVSAPPAQSQNVVVVPVGAIPRSVAIDPVTNLALVTNSGDNTVSVVDLTTERVTRTIANTGGSSPAGVAVNLKGQAVVANQQSNSVAVLDIATGNIRAVITVGFSPIAVAVNPATNIAVVANSNGNSISIVDLNTFREVTQITDIANPVGIQAVAIDPDLNIAAVASSTSNNIALVDLAKRQVITTIQVDLGPNGVAIERASKTAVVTNLNSNSISLVDVQNKLLRTTVPSIPVPQGVATSTGALSALVTTGSNNTLQIVNLATPAIQAAIPSLPNATAVAFNDRTGHAVVVLPIANSVAIIRSLGVLTTLDAAGFLAPVAPSSIVAGFGTSLATTTVSATTIPLPTALGNVSVQVGPVTSAPLFFVSSTQINFQVPKLAPDIYTVNVFNGSQRVASGGLTVVAAAPSLFTRNSQGTGQAAALTLDSSGNLVPNGTGSGQTPVSPDGIVVLFGTGGGATNPDPLTGSAATAAAPTVLTPTVQIGGTNATVLYSGAAPFLVGVWQLNVQIPANVTKGSAVPVIITIGGQSSVPAAAGGPPWRARSPEVPATPRQPVTIAIQ